MFFSFSQKIYWNEENSFSTCDMFASWKLSEMRVKESFLFAANFHDHVCKRRKFTVREKNMKIKKRKIVSVREKKMITQDLV